ncbi:hypothetical protein KSS87_007617 [Heliosperma pusillum]|nr:hypothetical protein KSS87_007617 [Heliosperma pusillum]
MSPCIIVKRVVILFSWWIFGFNVHVSCLVIWPLLLMDDIDTGYGMFI